MEQAKVQSAMSLFNEYIPQEKLYTFKQMLEKADDAKYNELMTIPMKSTITTLLLSVFLGGDRCGQILRGGHRAWSSETTVRMADFWTVAANRYLFQLQKGKAG